MAITSGGGILPMIKQQRMDTWYVVGRTEGRGERKEYDFFRRYIEGN